MIADRHYHTRKRQKSKISTPLNSLPAPRCPHRFHARQSSHAAFRRIGLKGCNTYLANKSRRPCPPPANCAGGGRRRRRIRGESSEAKFSRKFPLGCIDSRASRRYSQAQIPDLVAHANPRSRQAVQSFGLASPCAHPVLPHSVVDSWAAGHLVCLRRTLFLWPAQGSTAGLVRMPSFSAPDAVAPRRHRINSTVRCSSGGPRIL
jgi:hypothetical protein